MLNNLPDVHKLLMKQLFQLARLVKRKDDPILSQSNPPSFLLPPSFLRPSSPSLFSEKTLAWKKDRNISSQLIPRKFWLLKNTHSRKPSCQKNPPFLHLPTSLLFPDESHFSGPSVGSIKTFFREWHPGRIARQRKEVGSRREMPWARHQLKDRQNNRQNIKTTQVRPRPVAIPF